jgi:hypothetical protein
MGFEKGGNVLFLNVSCGELLNKKQDIHEKAFTGKLVKIKKVEDVYEDKPLDKVMVFMNDGKQTVAIKFTLESWYSVGFFQRIDNVNLDHEFTLGVMGSDKNNKISFCWMKQGDVKIEKTEIPIPEKVTVGKTTVTNFEKFTVHAVNWIEEFKAAKPETHEETPEPVDGEPLPF